MSAATRAWLAWVPALAWALIIFVLSSQPTLPNPAGIDDKPAHAATYGVLAVACLIGLAGARAGRVSGRLALVAWVLATLYGVSDEWHQSFVPGRTPDVADVLADAVGAALAVGVAWASAILLARRSLAPRA